MNGIINVLKPPGMTSFDVVAYLRKLLQIKKIGHTGTLDPGTAGVLPLCIGNATKAIEYFTDKGKEYRAELTLGVSTDTQDSTGRVIRTSDILPEREQILETINSFIGKQMQVPPMYSAVSIDGVRLYKLARNGVEVERPPREIEIYSIDILSIIQNKKIIFDVKCSKGTYVRTLCADIGEKLGCGGHMSFLLRTAAGNFKLQDAVTLEEIKRKAEENRIEEILIPTDSALNQFGYVKLNNEDQKKLINGAYVPIRYNMIDDELVRVYDSSGNFIALAEVNSRYGNKFLKSKKLFL